MTRPHALITGASAGIGAAIARRFAKEGFNLTLVARREERLRELAAELDVDCFVRPTDLSSSDVVPGLVADAVEALGEIDVLVNNAGIQYVEATVGVSTERIEKIFAVNVTTPMVLQNAVLPSMLSRRRGTIVNISSMSAITPTPGMSHYSGSKAALAACSESLRAEVKSHGVNVVTVYPGPVHSDMEEAAREAYEESAAMENVPTGTADGLAELVWKAVERGKGRVIYPRIYGFARYFRVTSEWITRRFTPPLLGSDE